MGVFIVASVGSFNDWQKEKQFLRLQAESDKDNTVSYCTLLNAQDCVLSLNEIYASFKKEILTDCYR
jgi:hypothetical protein